MNTNDGRYVLAAAAAALLSTTPHRADAQAPPGTVVSGTSGLEEIVVTSRKRDESSLNVPRTLGS